MGKSGAQRQYEQRNRIRGGPPREPLPHGTLGAVRRHQRARTPLCGACKKFYNGPNGYQARIRKARNERLQRGDTGSDPRATDVATSELGETPTDT